MKSYRRKSWIIFVVLTFITVVNYGCNGCLISGYTLAIGAIQKQFCDVSMAQKMGVIEDNSLTEASGLVASRKSPGLLYSHNDSGGNATVHVLNSSGGYLGKINLQNIIPVDVEDIAIGPSSTSNRDYLYLGDIGNNRGTRKKIYVYRFLEPKIADIRSKIVEVPADEVVRYTLLYPNEPHDIETLIVDPLSEDIYLVQKNWFGTTAAIYKFTQPNKIENNYQITLEKVGVTKGWMITAGDISSDGTNILLRNYLSSWLFTRRNNERLTDVLTRKENCSVLLHVEKQGESIAFKYNNMGFYTTSEGRNPPIYYYKFKHKV